LSAFGEERTKPHFDFGQAPIAVVRQILLFETFSIR
jgi:hypothetical protein